MTITEPNPTAAELAKADSVAALNFPFAADERDICTLARCYRLLRHQLVESERAREALRSMLTEIEDKADGCGGTWARNRARAALAADLTATARESAENTAEETMTEAEVSRDCGNKNHDDGVIRNGKCSACGGQLLKLIGPEEPAPAQTPEPAEPSDEGSQAFWQWRNGDEYKPTFATRDVFMIGYRAGLAAEAAAHASAEGNSREKLREARADLERVRAELAEPAAHVDELNRRLVEDAGERSRLRAQARARRAPPAREEVAILLHRLNACIGTCEDYLDDADAVLRLFAEAPPVGVEELAEDLDRAVRGHNRKAWCALDQDTLLCIARAAMTALGFQAEAESPASAVPAKVEPQSNKCTKCRGSGMVATGEYTDEPCPECRGEGVRQEPAKPAEPTPQPGGFLDALTRRVEEVARHHDLRLDSLCKRLEDISMTLGAYGKKLDELEATKPKSK